MSRMEVTTDSDRFEALRHALDAMRALTEQPRVNLVTLAKAFQRVAVTMRAAATEHGPPSTRLAAVERALDLKTPKSRLEAFLEGS